MKTVGIRNDYIILLAMEISVEYCTPVNYNHSSAQLTRYSKNGNKVIRSRQDSLLFHLLCQCEFHSIDTSCAVTERINTVSTSLLRN